MESYPWAWRRRACVCLLLWGLSACLLGGSAHGQVFRRGGQEFAYLRPVELAASGGATIAVVEFYHHGQIDPQGRNVVAAAGNDVLPTRVLQLGPGDFCRLAFQIATARGPFEILYGGAPFPEDRRPAWTAQEGLLLEVREYRECNLNSFSSVKEAFESAKPIGADYVQGVFHAGNPLTLVRGPYMSRYSGVIHVPKTGTYGFYTSSQDCSFLLIDGKIVAEAPGRHPPEYRARPDSRRDVSLSAGPHQFEYYHVATTEVGIAVAAWEVEPRPGVAAPTAIPADVFRTSAIVRPAVGPPMSPSQRFLPDFRFKIVGAVALPDNETPLIAVEFQDASPPPLVSSAKVEWDFGDGQTAQGGNVAHVFLRPGLFSVKETVTRAGRPFEMSQRLWIGEPLTPGREKPLQLDDVLPVLDTYRPQTLDAQSLLQLVQAYLAKADQFLPPPPPDTVFPDQEQPSVKGDSRGPAMDPKTREAERRRYLARAAQVTKDGLRGGNQSGDRELLMLLRVVTPIFRDVLEDSAEAGSLMSVVLPRLEGDQAKAEAHLLAADILLNDLFQAAESKKHLDLARSLLKDPAKHESLGAWLRRLEGDWFATQGRREEALAAYSEAEGLVSTRRNEVERTAWRGAHSRSTEQFLRTAELDRAAAQLRAWVNEFPSDTVEGYVSLLWGKYWFARKNYDAVTAWADRMLVLNPYSPYIEELLLLSAQADVARNQPDRAKATLESLIKDYPGSPLVGEAKELLKKITAGTSVPKTR